MLKEINDWILSNSEFQVKMNQAEYNDSLVVDFENEDKIARFTVWDDKSCMLEVMLVDTGQYIINERNEFSEFSEFSEMSEVVVAFKRFVALLN